MGARCRKHLRLILRETRALAAPRGIVASLDSRHRHPHLVLQGPAGRRTTPLSGSPRNVDDAIRMKLADIRRILREMSA